ncbi:hypothetical protein GCM10009077_34210 [Roseibium denhamense]
MFEAGFNRRNWNENGLVELLLCRAGQAALHDTQIPEIGSGQTKPLPQQDLTRPKNLADQTAQTLS